MGEAPLHQVRTYQDELARLRDLLERMGQIAVRQVAEAHAALIQRDVDRAAEVIQRDAELDHLENEIDNFCVRLLALRQPLAGDLRLIVAALKASHNLERIGDYASNGARRAILLASLPGVGSSDGFTQMALRVGENLQGAVEALVRADAARAAAVWAADVPVDEIYKRIFREMLIEMMADPHNITAATHLLFVARNLERIGDHATNIAEMAYYAACGEALPENRPKASS